MHTSSRKLIFSYLIFVFAVFVSTGLNFNPQKSSSTSPPSPASPAFSPAPGPSPSELYYPYLDLPQGTKGISYTKQNRLYYRTWSRERLSEEKLVLELSRPIIDYSFSKDLKYLAYTYYSKDEPVNRGEVGGMADIAMIKNLETGESKKIFTGNTNEGFLTNLNFTGRNSTLFISTDLNILYAYDPISQKLTDISPLSDSEVKEDSFCRGYFVVDQSPDKSHLLLRDRCYEGFSSYLFNLNTRKLLKLGFVYGDGKVAEYFLADGEIAVVEYDYSDLVSYGKYNYKNELVHEMPLPPNKFKSPFQIRSRKVGKYPDEHSDFFIKPTTDVTEDSTYFSQSKSVNRYLGENLEDIRFIK